MHDGLYRSKLIRSIIALEVVAVCVALISSFLVVFDTLSERMIVSGDIKAKTLFQKAGNAKREMETTMRFIAGNRVVSSLAADLSDADAHIDIDGTMQQMCIQLKKQLALCPNVKQFIVLTRNVLITDTNILPLPQPADELFWKNNDAKRRFSLSTVASLLDYPPSMLNEYTCFLQNLSNGVVLIGMMEEGGVFRELSSIPMCSVLDEQGESVFSTIDSADIRHAVEAYASAFVEPHLSSEWVYRLIHPTQGLFFWNAYYDGTNGFTYLLLKPISELLGSFIEPCLVHMSICVIFVLVLHMTVLRMTIEWCISTFSDLRKLILENKEEETEEKPLLSERLRKNMLFRRRLLITCLVATLPPLLTVLLVRPIYSGAVLKQIKADSQESILQTAALMEQRIAESMHFARQLASDSRIYAYLSNEKMCENIENTLFTSGVLDSNIHMIRLYNAEGTPLFASDSEQASSLTHTKQEQDYVLDMDINAPSHASLTIPVSSETLYGYIEIGFSMADYLTPGALEDKSGYRYLFDSSKWRLVGAPPKSAYKTLTEGIAQGRLLDTRLTTDSYFVNVYSDRLRKETRSLLFISRTLANTNWTLIHAIEVTPLLDAANVSMNSLIMVAAYTILLIFSFITLLTPALFKPLRKLEMYFFIAKPNTEQNAFDGSDEFALIANAYQEAITRTEHLNAQLVASAQEFAKLERRKRQTEMIALQSQLDSHLISNIFVSMKILLKEGKQQELRQIIDATARFLRGGLSVIENDVPFYQECQHLNAYMIIQQFRYKDRIAFSIHADDPSIQCCMVPRLMLQPVVENAVHHGMRVDRRLNIEITAVRVDDDIRIVISNDGELPDEEICRSINERLLQKDHESDHIGLQNLQERIQLRYGSAYGIVFAIDRQTHTTSVIIRLPYRINDIEEIQHV